MYLNDDIKRELDYFKRMNAHFTIKAGKSTKSVNDVDEKILYMALSASLAMDITEDGFFEEFVITDKLISGREELQLDAYAFIEAESANEKHLHLFQYKLHTSEKNSVSPVELMNFATLMNNVFVHPELRPDLNNPVLKEVDDLIQAFLSGRRGRKVSVHCHFINNAQGINKSNEKSIQDVLGRFEYDKQHKGFRIQVYGLQEIVDLAVTGKIRVDVENVDFIIDGQHPYRFEDNASKSSLGLPKKVLIGICNVNEFIRLQNKYHHNQLYSENIRLYLGDRAAVNKDIISTITSDASIWFPYMNNGISIICDEFSIGTVNNNKKTVNIELKNMQIINGCQTVNALYSAKYTEQTQDNFRASNVLVRIYQIDPGQHDFKLNIIKATNNQNAVKTYSLLANDPIQIKIQETLKSFDYIYDRKGEAKQQTSEKVISMPNGALAYRAVYWFEGQALRSRIGQSRVFQNKEYEKIYKQSALENDKDLFELSSKILISSVILDHVRDLIREKSDVYYPELPIFKKSSYYLAGYVYATNKAFFDNLIDQMIELLEEGNIRKIQGKNIPSLATHQVLTTFDRCVADYIVFYKSLVLKETDTDNLLKNKEFSMHYKNLIKSKIGNIDDTEAD